MEQQLLKETGGLAQPLEFLARAPAQHCGVTNCQNHVAVRAGLSLTCPLPGLLLSIAG